MTPLRVTYAQTHPVQYMAPLFRYIARERADLDLTVLYASTPMPEQQGVGFGEAFTWDVGVTESYAHRILAPASDGRRFDSDSFAGADVGPVDEALAAAAPDVVVVPGWHSAFYLRVVAACRRRGIPVLYRGDSHLMSGPRGIRRPLWAMRTRAALKMFDGYLAVGTRSREYLQRFGAVDPLIFDSPHAIDNGRFAAAADAASRDAVRARLGAREDDFLVAFAGKFTSIKRPLDLIAAASRLGSNVALAMIGNGSLADDLRVAAERLGVRATWCGFVNQAAVPELLRAADCVSLPSESESWGLVVNEALACGTPCVVSHRVGCAPDLIREDASGAVHHAGDVGGLAAALDRVRTAKRAGRITVESCRAMVSPFTFAAAAEGLRRGADRVVTRRRAVANAARGEPRIVATLGNMVSVFGLERMTFEVLRTLRERGAAVHCIVNRWQSSRVVDLADSLEATWSTGYYWYELRRRASVRGYLLAAWDVLRTSVDLLRDARRFHPTHIFAPEFNAILRSAPALWTLRRLGIRVVLRLGNAPEPGRFYAFIWRHIVDRCVDQYVPNSQFIQRELLQHGIAPNKSRVIYNTVPYRAGAWQPHQGTPGRVIFVGQIIPPKGLDVLLDAVAQLRRRGLDVTLDVVGDIDGWEPPGYTGYRARIRARAQQPDLAGAVRLLGVREDVPMLMAQASVHCLPSRPEQKEGFTVSTLEAKRAGLPSVVSQSGALPEMVRHTVDGWICSDVTAESVAEGLEYFVADPERARRAGEQARAAEMTFSRGRFATEWAEVFSVHPAQAPSTVKVQSS